MKERYFSHDANARVDPKIIKLRMQYGMEGYGIYFAILEMMSLEIAHELPYTDDQFDVIAFDLRTNIPIGEFVVYCVDIGLFVEKNGVFWSESFKRRQKEAEEKAAKRSENATNAIKARWDRRKDKQEDPAPAQGVVDEGWKSFIQAYETKIGMIPSNKLPKFVNYYETLGPEIMQLAIEQTAKANPEKPAPFMIAILQQWIEDGVDSVQKAKASILDHDRAVGRKKEKAEEANVPEFLKHFY